MKAAEKDDWGTAGQIIQALQFTVENKDARIAELEACLTAIIERWDTPLWKHVEPTAAVISRARAVLQKSLT